MNIFDLNKNAWDRAVEGGENPYTKAVSAQQVAQARAGKWSLHLTDNRPVPPDWFPALEGLKVLCLASGGGQQTPILAACGAKVTLLDASPRQLAQDQFVAARDGLTIHCLQGDMAVLPIAPESFDLVFNAVSTLFVPDVRPVWRECARVLRRGGILITGFMNPDEFIFDVETLDNEGKLVVRFGLPYIEHETLSPSELAARIRAGEMFHFSHTLEAQLGGLIEAGFVINGFYEDRRSEEDGNPIRYFIPSFFAVRAIKQ